MRKVTKQLPKTKPKPVSTKDSTVKTLSLPTSKSEPVETVEKATWLIYGEKKIGKTSLASMFDGAMFLMTEPGGKGLSIFQRDVLNWKEFCEYNRLLSKSKDFNTVVVDTSDNLYKLCFEHVCKTQGVDHPSEAGYGSVWDKIRSEFRREVSRLMMSGKGVVFISHAKVARFERRSGTAFDKVTTTMQAAASEIISAYVDIIGYYGYQGRKRYLTIAGSDALESGCRLKYNFWCGTPLEADRVHSIPMGKSEEQGYANLVKAFENKQTDPCVIDEEPALSEKRAPMTSSKSRR